jgi:chemotaxis protein CheC
MMLNPQHTESLIELVNIAFGRAASSLSDLTGERVIISAPTAKVHPISELARVFEQFKNGDVATVHQIFTGSVSGNAFLLFDEEGALILTRLLSEDGNSTDSGTDLDRGILQEVGNILLGACLGTFGNILQVHISFSVPKININSLHSLIHSFTIGKEELQYALVVLTELRLKESAVGGYLVLVLGISSLERLIQAIERLG